ncbi:site-specific integrase [Cognatishimia sp. F0-27]|uniref:tyrosine-type recombinase/integrase n=1 Tax=Cognatishimia sp. F0-27 TaxID=2816855 RepID=UPI001D0C7959|nr:site-specific integrase [Cognatishimia sp. F0-27]MCC1494674.1 site-specific integrase [Cognatishimia sp. F0-27]
MSGTQTERINEKLTIYRRPRSTRWQARIRLSNGEWHRFSTGKTEFEEAKEEALKQYYTADFKQKNKLPPSTRKFRRVAEFAKQRMQEELDSGGGRVVFKDYITAIDRYLIPFFGNKSVASIKVSDLKEFDAWRTEKLGRRAAHSTINTHNSALNRVLDEAEMRGWITSSIRPSLVNKGKSADSRGSFTDEEYKFIYTKMRTWYKNAHRQDTRETREVLRNYILFLANTGVRHGTEALNLKWKNVSWFEKDGERYLSIYVSGKTGGRELIARDNTRDYLDRQRELNADLTNMTFDEVLVAKVDDHVFKTRSGSVVTLYNLARSFKAFLREFDMETGSDGKVRTLYSFRHFYATQGLSKGFSTHILSKQMGNSTQMLDRFYSKLSAKLNADLHSGRNELTSKKKDDEPAKNTVHDQLFDLLDQKHLSEDGLLKALGVGADGYEPNASSTMRAIASFKAGGLSEDGLLRILGN